MYRQQIDKEAYVDRFVCRESSGWAKGTMELLESRVGSHSMSSALLTTRENHTKGITKFNDQRIIGIDNKFREVHLRCHAAIARSPPPP